MKNLILILFLLLNILACKKDDVHSPIVTKDTAEQPSLPKHIHCKVLKESIHTSADSYATYFHYSGDSLDSITYGYSFDHFPTVHFVSYDKATNTTLCEDSQTGFQVYVKQNKYGDLTRYLAFNKNNPQVIIFDNKYTYECDIINTTTNTEYCRLISREETYIHIPPVLTKYFYTGNKLDSATQAGWTIKYTDIGNNQFEGKVYENGVLLKNYRYIEEFSKYGKAIRTQYGGVIKIFEYDCK